MPNRSLWNWTIVATAALAVVGVIVARLLQALLPPDALSLVVGVFFALCVLVMSLLVVVFTLGRR